ncbi:hypothetical protein D3C78_518800 [compost metagenome]
MAREILRQRPQQGVQRLAPGGGDVAAPEDAGAVQQLAAAVADDGERLAEEAGQGAGEDEAGEPRVIGILCVSAADIDQLGPAMPAAQRHLDLLVAQRGAQFFAGLAIGLQAHYQVGRRLTVPGRAAEAVAAGHLLVGHFFQPHRHPADGGYLVDALVIGLQGAHLHLPIGGVEAQLVPHLEAALLQGAGQHCAGAAGGKDPVHIEARWCLFTRAARGALFAGNLRFLYIGKLAHDGGVQAVDVVAALGADADDIGHHAALVHHPLQQRLLQQFKLVGAHQIALVDADQQARHPHGPEQAQVIAGHRHPALVGGDDQEHQIQAPEPRHHVADIALVAGHVDDAYGVALAVVEVGEAEILGHADGLLVGAGRGDAGEGLDQQRLAVIHVAGQTDDGAVGGHGIRAPVRLAWWQA